MSDKNRNKCIAMCPCTKFQLIWRTSDFWTKFDQRNVSDKNFGKINIKFEMRIWQCTPVINFSPFGELQFLKPNLPKKDFSAEYQDKLNMRITSFNYKTLLQHGWFQVVSGRFRSFLGDFRWFQVVPRFNKYEELAPSLR